jgi:methyl-accepting chemotaxis protein
MASERGGVESERGGLAGKCGGFDLCHCEFAEHRADSPPEAPETGGAAMTIDERLDRLGERHEALAQSVELLTSDVGELRASVAENTQNLHALSQIVAQTTDAVRDLLRIADLPQRRLEKLKGE